MEPHFSTIMSSSPSRCHEVAVSLPICSSFLPFHHFFFNLKISMLLSASLIPSTIVTEGFDKAIIPTEALKCGPFTLMPFKLQASMKLYRILSLSHLGDQILARWPGCHRTCTWLKVSGGRGLYLSRMRIMESWLCPFAHLEALGRTRDLESSDFCI